MAGNTIVCRWSEPGMIAFMLQWNHLEMMALNWKYRGQAEDLNAHYLDRTRRAVSEGRLAATFAQKAEERIPHTRHFWYGPMHPPLWAGQAFPSRNALLMRPEANSDTRRHEQTHLVGGFGSSLFNEVATESIAIEIRGNTPHSTAYASAMYAVHEVLRIAGLGLHELSGIFVHSPNRRQNEAMLADRIDGAVGNGVTKWISSTYQRRLGFYGLRHQGAQSHTYAGADLIRAMNPGLSRLDALRIAWPGADEAQLESRAEHLDTLNTLSYPRYVMSQIHLRTSEIMEAARAQTEKTEIPPVQAPNDQPLAAPAADELQEVILRFQDGQAVVVAPGSKHRQRPPAGVAKREVGRAGRSLNQRW
jgi:hypothetical protein